MTHKRLFIKHLKDLSWFLPFICFISGYLVLHKAFYNPITRTPLLIGKTVSQALQILSEQNLNMRMMAEKEDADIPAGTILAQTPAPHASARPQQTVFLVVSKKSARPIMPELRNTHQQDYVKKLKEIRARFRCFEIESNAPAGICLGHIPATNKEIPFEGVLIYKASTGLTSYLMPSLKNKSVKEVTTFLKEHNLPVQIHHNFMPAPNHTCDHCYITEQKPLPGSFVSLKNPFTVQLKI